jgi:hypothetical protein
MIEEARRRNRTGFVYATSAKPQDGVQTLVMGADGRLTGYVPLPYVKGPESQWS